MVLIWVEAVKIWSLIRLAPESHHSWTLIMECKIFTDTFLAPEHRGIWLSYIKIYLVLVTGAATVRLR
jgi:hypothetical protein